MKALPIQCQVSYSGERQSYIPGLFHAHIERVPRVEATMRELPRRRISARVPGDRSWRNLQCALPLTLPPKGITPLMSKVLLIVERSASSRVSMPTNIELGEMLGRGRQSVAKAFDRLVALGRLRVDVKHGYRRVYVVGKGGITGWGEHRLGHAPFSKNPRGTVAPAPEAAPQRLGRGDGFALLGVRVTDEFVYRNAVTPRSIASSNIRECQYILSEGNGSCTTYCKQKTMSGKSWCPQHYSIVYGKKQHPDVVLDSEKNY